MFSLNAAKQDERSTTDCLMPLKPTALIAQEEHEKSEHVYM